MSEKKNNQFGNYVVKQFFALSPENYKLGIIKIISVMDET
jgi:hypothetical protein